MGLSAVRRFPGIAGETKCEGDGVGRYDGLWSGEVTHRTHWPHLNLQVLNQRNSRKQKWKPLTTRRQVTDRPTKRKLFSSKNAMTFVQDGAPAQTSKWLRHGVWRICQTFIPMDDFPANSSDLNIIDETTYKDPAPETLDKLRRRLWLRRKNVNSRHASEARALSCSAA